MIALLKYLLVLESPKRRYLQRLLSNPLCLRKVKELEKKKALGSDEIDSQIISFYLVEGDKEYVIRKIHIVFQIEEDPKTYKEAMTSKDTSFLKEIINDEMDSIMSNQTLELLNLPLGSKLIG